MGDIHCPIPKKIIYENSPSSLFFATSRCIMQRGVKLQIQITPRSWSKKQNDCRVWISGPGGYFRRKKTVVQKSGATVPLKWTLFYIHTVPSIFKIWRNNLVTVSCSERTSGTAFSLRWQLNILELESPTITNPPPLFQPPEFVLQLRPRDSALQLAT